MNRKQFKLFIAASFLILAGIFCGGCTNKNAEDDVPGYTVYYLNTQGRSLVGNEYKTPETDKLLLVEELLERMRNVPSDLDCQSAIPVRVGDFTEKMERNPVSGCPYKHADPDRRDRLSLHLLCRSAPCGQCGKSGRNDERFRFP